MIVLIHLPSLKILPSESNNEVPIQQKTFSLASLHSVYNTSGLACLSTRQTRNSHTGDPIPKLRTCHLISKHKNLKSMAKRKAAKQQTNHKTGKGPFSNTEGLFQQEQLRRVILQASRALFSQSDNLLGLFKTEV